jgi:2-polyprenyl-3-methyl-5-hydroxy-6-metoxy-1,4-benzoquinol methylase
MEEGLVSNYSGSSFKRDDENTPWYKIFNLIKPETKVLDVGCSSGNFGEVLIKEKECVVHGIEIDIGDLKKAKQKLTKVFDYNVETDALAGLDKDYDYIFFGDVIEHLVWPVDTLAKIRGYLKDEGRLLFSVPNMTNILVRLMLLQGRFEYGRTGLLDQTHLHYYDHKFLQSVLNQAGFEIEILDPVKKDLPSKVIAAELAKVGLKSTKKFEDYTQRTQASIYQFVGQAKKAAPAKPHTLEISSPIDLFQRYMNDTETHYNAQIKQLKADLHNLEAQNRVLKAKLDRITNSIPWKAATKIKQAQKRVLSRKNDR